MTFSKKNHYLPVIDIIFGGLKVQSLLDTGASVTILEHSIFKKIQNNPEIQISNIDVNITSISGDNLDIIGCFNIPIQIGSKRIRHKIYIVKKELAPQYKAIIGYDILKSQKFKICLENDTLTTGSSTLKIRDANSTNSCNHATTNYARLISKSSLSPFETRIISLKLDKPLKEGDEILFSPTLKNSEIELPNSLCRVDSQNRISIMISNLTARKIPLNKNTRVGIISTDFQSRDMNEIKNLRRQELKESDFRLDHIDTTTRKELLKLIFEYADIFSKRLYTIGQTDALLPTFHVDLSNLPSTRPYHVPHALEPELRKQLNELIAANLIEPSDSHISFPLLMLKKRNETGDPKQQKYRLVVDYRRLNDNLRYPRHKLPLINHLLENLRGSNYFTSLDLSSSFWQIPLRPENRDMTTFSSPFGSFRFKVLPQGLNASPEVFCKLSDKILAPITDLKISNYIDDYCVGSESISEMLFKLRKLFDRFRQFGLTLNPEKCSFMLPEINFLGHKLDRSGIQPVDENIKKITDFPIPNTVKKVRRFIGLVSYFRRFVPKFSELTAPLTNLIRKRKKFQWTPTAQKSFEILKQKLSEPPILTHPNFNKQFILSTDSSDNALGASLGQKDENGIIHPIAYFSKKLNDTQLRYTIMEKELMSIVEALKSFKYYLYGREFIIRCDNASITKLKKLENPGNRVTRWFTFLSEFNYKFELIKSEDNQVADIFSRDFFVNSIQIDLPTILQIKEAQKCDTKLLRIVSQLQEDSVSLQKPYFLKDGLLMHTAFIPRSGKSQKVQQIVIPEKYKPHILAAKHLPHFGHLKTYDSIREKYFWEGLYSDTKNYVDSCKHCMSYKSPNKFPPVPLQRNYMPSRPNEFVSCDYIGKLPRTQKGNSYILTFIDHFTKFVKLYSVPDQTAKTTAEKFLDFACTFGFPQYLYSDKGPCFISDVFKRLCKRLGVTKLNTTPLNPRANGQSERINLNIKKSLSIFAQETEQWDDYVNYYELLYNSSLHSVTHEKPAFLHLSYDPTLPTDVIHEETPIIKPSYDDYVARKTYQLQYTFKKVRDSIIKAAEDQEQYQHKTAKYRNFYPGQLVYLYSPDSDRNAHLPKRRSYIGPMRILEIHNKVLCTVIDASNPKAKPVKVHTQRLIPYIERRKELDFLQKLVQEQKREQQIKGSDILKRPHATFDDLTDTDIISFTLHSNTKRGNETQNTASCESPLSDATEIYEYEVESPLTSTPKEGLSQRETVTTHNYDLRGQPGQQNTGIVNSARKLLDWSLTMTQPDTSVPTPIKFLQTLSKALD